jgi:hypothetical protein
MGTFIVAEGFVFQDIVSVLRGSAVQFRCDDVQ